MKTTILWGAITLSIIGIHGGSPALAKGRTPPVREIELQAPTEFCNSLGCLTVRPGKVQVYDFAKPQLMAGELAQETRIFGVVLPSDSRVRLRHENPEGENHNVNVEDCALRANALSGVRFPTFGIVGDAGVCFDTLTGNDLDTTVEGELSGWRPLSMDGFPLQQFKPVRIAYDRSALQNTGTFKGKLLSGTIGRDLYYQTEAQAIRLRKGDGIQLQESSEGATPLWVTFSDERTFYKGLSGTNPIYDIRTGTLTYFTAGANLSVNGMQVEPGTYVAMHSNGAPRSAVPRRNLVQRVNDLDLGSMVDQHWDYPIHFWPNGAIMWATVGPTGNGIRIADFQYPNSSLNQIYWLNAYIGHLGFNQDGELRILAFRRVNEDTTTRVRFSRNEDMVPISDELIQQGIRPHINPNEAEVRFLSTH